MAEIAAGQKVRLKSGGPTMTVQKSGKEAFKAGTQVWCKWFNAKGELKHATFTPDELEEAPDESATDYGKFI